MEVLSRTRKYIKEEKEFLYLGRKFRPITEVANDEKNKAVLVRPLDVKEVHVFARNIDNFSGFTDKYFLEVEIGKEETVYDLFNEIVADAPVPYKLNHVYSNLERDTSTLIKNSLTNNLISELLYLFDKTTVSIGKELTVSVKLKNQYKEMEDYYKMYLISDMLNKIYTDTKEEAVNIEKILKCAGIYSDKFTCITDMNPNAAQTYLGLRNGDLLLHQVLSNYFGPIIQSNKKTLYLTEHIVEKNVLISLEDIPLSFTGEEEENLDILLSYLTITGQNQLNKNGMYEDISHASYFYLFNYKSNVEYDEYARQLDSSFNLIQKKWNDFRISDSQIEMQRNKLDDLIFLLGSTDLNSVEMLGDIITSVKNLNEHFAGEC